MATTATQKAPRRRRRSADEIMTRLVTAAGEEFQRSGYRGATTAAIARRADVTEAQLFRYFASKAELFREAIFRPLCEDLEAFNTQYMNQVADEDHEQAARRYIAELQAFIAARADLFMVLILAEAYAPDNAPGVGAVDGLRTYFENNATTMQERLGARASLDPELMVRVSFAAVLANVLFQDWLFPEQLADAGTINQAVIEFVLAGLGAGDAGQAPSIT